MSLDQAARGDRPDYTPPALRPNASSLWAAGSAVMAPSSVYRAKAQKRSPGRPCLTSVNALSAAVRIAARSAVR